MFCRAVRQCGDDANHGGNVCLSAAGVFEVYLTVQTILATDDSADTGEFVY